MTKKVKAFSAWVIVAAIVGLLFASIITHIQGPCTAAIPGENTAKCVEFSKVVMCPSDLFNNKQNSLVKFLGTFAVASVTTYALLRAYNQFKKRKPNNS